MLRKNARFKFEIVLIYAALLAFNSCGVIKEGAEVISRPIAKSQCELVEGQIVPTPFFFPLTYGSHSIVNGVADTGNPAVVALVSDEGSVCTGTFVTGKALITASHCIDPDKDSGGMRYVSGNSFPNDSLRTAFESGIKPQIVFYAGPTTKSGNEITSGEADVAILVFDSNVAPATVELLNRRPNQGDQITLVGFGLRYLTDSKDTSTETVKRVGYNSAIVDSSRSCEAIFITGDSDHTNTGSEPGNKVLPGSGDSGGAVLIEGKLAGVMSSSGEFTNTPSKGSGYCVDLSWSKIRDFMAHANENGANIAIPSL